MGIKYQIGDVVEIIGDEPSLIGTYYETIVVSKDGSRRYKVKCKYQLKEDNLDR